MCVQIFLDFQGHLLSGFAVSFLWFLFVFKLWSDPTVFLYADDLLYVCMLYMCASF